MFAVIKTGGKQYKVQEGEALQVEKLNQEKGNTVVFNQVLLIESDQKTIIGMPFIEKAEVKAVVLENLKSDKVTVFKKKRRKQYKKTKGHRQDLTLVRIEKILFGEEKVKPETKKKAEEKTDEVKKTETVKSKRKAPSKDEKAKKVEKSIEPSVKKQAEKEAGKEKEKKAMDKTKSDPAKKKVRAAKKKAESKKKLAEKGKKGVDNKKVSKES